MKIDIDVNVEVGKRYLATNGQIYFCLTVERDGVFMVGSGNANPYSKKFFLKDGRYVADGNYDDIYGYIQGNVYIDKCIDDEIKKEIKITKDDIGKKVKLLNNDVFTICEQLDDGDYRLLSEDKTHYIRVNSNGRRPSPYHAVEILEEEKLLPCPFCGCEAYCVSDFKKDICFIACSNHRCKCRVYNDNKQNKCCSEIIKQWNKREIKW